MPTLFAWLGNSDLRASEDASGADFGPILMALKTGVHDRLVLLSDHGQQKTQNFLAWLGKQFAGAIDVRYATLRSPTDFEDIYKAASGAVSAAPVSSPKAPSPNSKNQPDQRIKKMSSLKKFAVATPRPLPVIVLADTSGSMGENGKIEALNAAMKDMVSTFAKESRLRAEIQVGLITFGGKAQMHLPLVAAHGVAGFSEFKADGVTPMGAAFDLARQLLEDKDHIPSRAYRPVLILLSDGQPTDDWEAPFKALRDSERAQKATRLAMAIGPDADEAMLKDFANDVEAPIFKAHNARDIHRFFRAVTMSVTTRTASQNPDISTAFVVPPPDDDALDLDFQ